MALEMALDSAQYIMMLVCQDLSWDISNTEGTKM